MSAYIEGSTNQEPVLPEGKQIDMGDMGTYTLKDWLLRTSLKFLTAYRMQLFLYLKQTTHPEMSTSNCWLGQDAPPAEG